MANSGLQLRRATHVLIAPEAQRFEVWRLGPILLLCLVWVGCGGRGLVNEDSNNSSTPPATASSTTAAPVPAPNASSTATVVNVGAGQSVSGVNVVVTTPASSTLPNAEDLGVNPVSGLGMAANTGGSIHRGSTMRILLFGPGLSSSMKVTVAGPEDIAVSSLQGIEATDNTPGVAFTAAVAANAALGARTVYLKGANGDITSFTGGLEVIP